MAKSKNYYNTNIFNEEKKYMPDKIAIAGKSAYNFFKNQCVPNKKLVKVESLRYNWLQGHNNTKKIKNNNILILGDYDDEFNIKLLDIITKLKVNLNGIQKYNFFFKPHPASNLNLKKRMDTKYLEYREIKKICNKYFIVISSNTTSAPLEFAKSFKNFLIFLDKRKINFSRFIKNENVSYFSDVKSLKKFLFKKI